MTKKCNVTGPDSAEWAQARGGKIPAEFLTESGIRLSVYLDEPKTTKEAKKKGFTGSLRSVSGASSDILQGRHEVKGSYDPNVGKGQITLPPGIGAIFNRVAYP